MKNSKLFQLLVKTAETSLPSYHQTINLSNELARKLYGGFEPAPNPGCGNYDCTNGSCSANENGTNTVCTNSGCSSPGMSNVGCTNTGCYN